MPTKTFPAENTALAQINAFVRDEALPLGFSRKRLYAIELSVTEACENIIDHAYQEGQPGTIEVSVLAQEGQLKVTLKDFGVPFNPDGIPAPDLESPLDIRCERGFGVYTMRKLMDVVSYDFSQKGVNILTLIKFKDSQE